MKKVLFAMAVVAMASCANAAYWLTWDTGTVYAPAASGAGLDMDTVLESDSTVIAQLYVGTGLDGGSLTGPVAFSTGTSATGTDADGLMGGDTDAILNVGTYYGYIELTKGDSTMTSQVFSFEIPSGYAGENYTISAGDGGYQIELASGADLDDDLGAWPTTGWVASAAPTPGIPEPTSGLLMLVGLGALALRRRR